MFFFSFQSHFCLIEQKKVKEIRFQKKQIIITLKVQQIFLGSFSFTPEVQSIQNELNIHKYIHDIYTF